ADDGMRRVRAASCRPAGRRTAASGRRRRARLLECRVANHPAAMSHRSLLPRTYATDRAILAVLVALSAWLSLTLARGPGELSAIWVGNGILTGWLLSRRTSAWPGYLVVALLAELAARLLAGDGAVYAIAIAGCNLLEALGV